MGAEGKVLLPDPETFASALEGILAAGTAFASDTLQQAWNRIPTPEEGRALFIRACVDEARRAEVKGKVGAELALYRVLAWGAMVETVQLEANQRADEAISAQVEAILKEAEAK